MTIVLNTLLALPVYALMHRALLQVPARRPAPPPAPGLHDGRAQPDQPRLMPQRVEERLRPITPQLAWRVAVLGGIAFVLFGIVFFRLWYLQVLTGEEARVRRSQNGRRTEKIEAPRGDIVDRNSVPLVRTKRAAVVQIVPSHAARAACATTPRSTARSSPPPSSSAGAPRRATAFRRQLRDDGARTTKDETRELRRCAGAARRRARSRSRRCPARSRSCSDLYRRISEVIDVTPKTIHQRVIRGIADAPYSNVTIRTDVPPRRSSTTCASGRSTSRASSSPSATCAGTRRASSPRSCSGRSRRSPRSSATPRRALQGHRGGHADRPERARVAVRRHPARQGRLDARRRSTRSAAATSSARSP